MSRFHINPDTGVVGRCNPVATGKCKYGDTYIHGNTLEDAAEAYESFLEQDHDLFSIAQAEKKQLSEVEQLPQENFGNFRIAEMHEIDSSHYRPTSPSAVVDEEDGLVYSEGSKYRKIAEEYGKDYDAATISPYIENDIQKAIKSGFLPKELSYSVEKSYTGRSIVIHVAGLGSDEEIRQWEYDYETRQLNSHIPKTALPKVLEARVLNIANAYTREHRQGGKGLGRNIEVYIRPSDETKYYATRKEEAKRERSTLEARVSSLVEEGEVEDPTAELQQIKSAEQKQRIALLQSERAAKTLEAVEESFYRTHRDGPKKDFREQETKPVYPPKETFAEAQGYANHYVQEWIEDTEQSGIDWKTL